jgi:DNA-binding PadR family transcriptional regulator
MAAAGEELTPTGRVILGMIRAGRQTGYEMKQLVDVSTRFFWAASYGQIYPELRRLEEQGLVKGRPDPSNGRNRTVYSLTRRGERALDDWLASLDELTLELRHEGLLKVFFSAGRDAGEVREHMRQMREQHQEIADTLRALGEPVEDPEPGPAMVRSFGIDFNEFIAGWWRRAEEGLKADA